RYRSLASSNEPRARDALVGFGARDFRRRAALRLRALEDARERRADPLADRRDRLPLAEEMEEDAPDHRTGRDHDVGRIQDAALVEPLPVDALREDVVRAPGDDPAAQPRDGEVVEDPAHRAGSEDVAGLLELRRRVDELDAQVLRRLSGA